MFKATDGFTGDRIDHLLVKPRIRFAWRKPILQENAFLVEIYRLVVALITPVIVYDGEILSDWAGLQRLISHLNRHVIPKRAATSGIKCINFQVAVIRYGWISYP